MGVGTAVGAGVVLFICIALFVAGARMDESSVRSSVTHAVDAAPLRRSLASLKYENSKLRKQIDTAVEENRALRARLRAGLPQGASLEADISKTPLPVGSAVDGALSKGSVALADAGQRPSALAERLLTSTEFNKERAQAVAKNSQIILTFVNKIRLDFATTWVKHVRNLGLTNWLVGATDRPALRELKRLGIPCFDMTTNLPEGEWPWGSPSFKALGPHKIELIYKSITWVRAVLRSPGNNIAHTHTHTHTRARSFARFCMRCIEHVSRFLLCLLPPSRPLARHSRPAPTPPRCVRVHAAGSGGDHHRR